MDDATDDPMDDALDEDEAARNFGAVPGQELFDDIGLAGWDERSVWGYDAGVGSFYAQLWRNPGDGDAPDVWLSGVDPRYPWPGCLVLAVVEATGCDPLSVVRALGLANPRAALRTHSEAAGEAAPLVNSTDAYAAGRLAALEWVMGLSGATPGGQRPWRERQAPTPEEVTAEQYLVTARAYQPLDPYTRAWVGGADEALAWVLSAG